MIAPFTLGRTPPPPGPQATREAASALTPPLLDRVFPPDQSDPAVAERWIATLCPRTAVVA